MVRKRVAAVDRVSPADRPTGARHAASAQVAGFTSSSIVTLMHLAAASDGRALNQVHERD